MICAFQTSNACFYNRIDNEYDVAATPHRTASRIQPRAHLHRPCRHTRSHKRHYAKAHCRIRQTDPWKGDKRKQGPRKPASVAWKRWRCQMSAIYLIHESPHGLSILPSVVMDYRAGNPQTTVYANLQLPDGTAHGSPHGWWALAPPSHPYHERAWRLFSSAISYCHQ